MVAVIFICLLEWNSAHFLSVFKCAWQVIWGRIIGISTRVLQIIFANCGKRCLRIPKYMAAFRWVILSFSVRSQWSQWLSGEQRRHWGYCIEVNGKQKLLDNKTSQQRGIFLLWAIQHFLKARSSKLSGIIS